MERSAEWMSTKTPLFRETHRRERAMSQSVKSSFLHENILNHVGHPRGRTRRSNPRSLSVSLIDAPETLRPGDSSSMKVERLRSKISDLSICRYTGNLQTRGLVFEAG
ncbi:hypothetical protein KM043_010683 [Ampulex compressa]|nr:hypothetical protein KM043_010683 [Ampulex compressa]